MKRKVLRLFTSMMSMAILLSVTACGSSDETINAPDTAIAEDNAVAEAGVETKTATESTANETQTSDKAEIQDRAETKAKMEIKTETVEAKNVRKEAADDSKQYETLEDYYNNSEVKKELDERIASSSNDDMSTSVDIKGNEMIVIVKILNRSVVTDDLRAKLDEALEEQADTFRTQAKKISEGVGVECTVIMRYTDPDDNVLSEKAFTSD